MLSVDGVSNRQTHHVAGWDDPLWAPTISVPRESDPRRDPPGPGSTRPTDGEVWAVGRQAGDLDPTATLGRLERPLPQCRRLIGSLGWGVRPLRHAAKNLPPHDKNGAVRAHRRARTSRQRGRPPPPAALHPPPPTPFPAHSLKPPLTPAPDVAVQEAKTADPTATGPHLLASAARSPLARPAEQLGWPVPAATPTRGGAHRAGEPVKA